MDWISELPDCILIYILSMLSMKDMLKTSILSKRLCKLCALRRDLNFDIHNVFGGEKELLKAGYLVVDDDSTMVRYVDLGLTTGEFVKRVDQFVKNFQDTKIDSFMVNFYLNCNQRRIIDQWISFAIARGVGRVDLLFLGRPYAHRRTSNDKPYKFPFRLFSKSNASTLKHMHLQRCLVCHPTNFNFIPFTNLRSLTLSYAKVDEMFTTSLLSNCLLLQELSLIFCKFKSSMPKIVSSSLCHLEVTLCYVVSKAEDGKLIRKHVNLSSLDCLKLTTLNYRGRGLEALYINTPMLKSINYSILFPEILNAFAFFATLPELEILHLKIYLKVTSSLKITQPLKHLKQLNFIISWDTFHEVEFDLLWILSILQAFPLLQKLSVMVTYPKFFENQKDDIKDLEIFFHDEVKVIEMGGCVGNWYEIEFVMNILKYAHKLERIVLSPYWRDNDLDDWNSDPMWFQNGRERIRENLQDEEVVGEDKVIFI